MDYNIIIPTGFCHCGCGNLTTTSKTSWKGKKRDEPSLYIKGHAKRNPLQVVYGVKVCSICLQIKSLNNFSVYARQYTKEYLICSSICFSCDATRAKKIRTHETSKIRERARTLRRYYDMSLQQFDEMLEKQKGLCLICDKVLNMRSEVFDKKNGGHVDHCHSTGKVRGILCGNCNKGLGMFEDNAQRLKRAAEYLENSRK